MAQSAARRVGSGWTEVFNIIDDLEVSPSKDDDGRPYAGHPNVRPSGKAANARRYTLATPESEMHFVRNTTIAGFRNKFAGPAREE
jgi:hypothetical protein